MGEIDDVLDILEEYDKVSKQIVKVHRDFVFDCKKRISRDYKFNERQYWELVNKNVEFLFKKEGKSLIKNTNKKFKEKNINIKITYIK